MKKQDSFTAVAVLVLSIAACKAQQAPQPKPAEAKPAAAKDESPKDVEVTKVELAYFEAIPEELASEENPITPDKVALGRMLYYDTRLSAGNQISCDTCHDLGRYGIDPRPGASTSEGHNGQHGTRNAPTVYNAANQIAQFWDGRAPDIEEQAKGPILNPVEMAMPAAPDVMKKLKAVPRYVKMFKAAFPKDEDPMTYDNLGKAIGAFERGLVTPSRFDRFLGGDKNALTVEEKQGLKRFVALGCTTCHNGEHVGGASFQKAGLVIAWPNQKDQGRYEVTKNDADKMMFKVPVLRNITETGPYFHDGSVTDLHEAIRMMARYQLGNTSVPDEDVRLVAVFLGSLKGEIPKDYTAAPRLP